MTIPHNLHPSAAQMSALTHIAALYAAPVRIAEAAEKAPTTSAHYAIDGTTALELTIDTANLKVGDVILVTSCGETGSGNHTVVPKVAGKIKQIDGTTAAASTIMADLADWCEYHCLADGTLQVRRHVGCTFS